MRMIALLSLLCALTTCAVPPRAATQATALPETPTASPAAQPSPPPAPSLATSVPLALRNRMERRYELHLVDPRTGQEPPGYPPIDLGDNFVHTYSADGNRLAIIGFHGQSCDSYAGGSRCRPGGGVLHLIDLQAWREVTATLPVEGWVWPLAFSPNGTRVALASSEARTHTLLAIDARTGETIAQRDLGFPPSALEYSHDGQSLLIYGVPAGSAAGMTKPDPPRAVRLDARTLEVVWQQELSDVTSGFWCRENCNESHEEQLFAAWSPAVVLSHEMQALYILHADAETLTTVDFDARTVRSVEIREAQSWLERLLVLTAGVARAKGGAEGATKAAVLSPDGTRLYVVGQAMHSQRDADGHWQVTNEALGLQVIDVASGRRIAATPTEATEISLAPDGIELMLQGWEEHIWTEIFERQTLERSARVEAWEVVSVRQLDGQPIVLGRKPSRPLTGLAVLDPETFEVVHSWSVDSDAAWLIMR